MRALRSYFVLLTVALCPVQGDMYNFSKNSHRTTFYQNLTGNIDECLQNTHNGSRICEDLQIALNISTFVYYETDTLLNNIDEVILVIDLLLRHINDSSSLQITLGLPYLNYTTGRFIDNRLQDVYFSTKVTLSDATRQKLTSYIVAIVLTFFEKTGWNLGMSTTWRYKSRRPVVESVKEFLKYHFGESFQLPVGVGFCVELKDSYLTGDDWLINPRVADFVILRTDLDISGFSIHPDLLNKTLENNEKLQFVRRLLKDGDTIRPITWMFNFKVSGWKTPQPADYNLNRLPLYKWLLQSPLYNATVQKFLPTWIEICANLLLGMEMKNDRQIIVNNPEKISTIRGESKPKVIPSFKHTHMIGYVDELHRNISRVLTTNTEVILNEETWGTIVRHSRKFKDLFECDTTTPINAIVDVTQGIRQSWNALESYMKEILWGNLLGGIKISNVVFHSDDINHLQNIQSFLNATKLLNISVGCSEYYLDFVNIYVYRSNLTSVLQKRLCAPMSDMFNTFIWKVDECLGSTRSLCGGYTYFDVFLSREIFLRKFPDKKVILQFSTRHSTQEVSYA